MCIPLLSRLHSRFPFGLVLAALPALAAGAPLAAQQAAPDPAAMLLESGRRAYNEKNYTFAGQRLREFLAKFGSHKEAPQARYTLALVLLHGPEQNYLEAINLLQPLAAQQDAKEYPQVLYYLGLARRGLGIKELEQAVAKPQEANQRHANARQHFAQAIPHFAAAMKAVLDRTKVGEDEKAPPAEFEWAARARCDLAEMYLRTQELKKAEETAAVFLKTSPWVKSRYRAEGLYHHGFACFLQKQYLAAGRSLSMSGVGTHPAFGTHARYLLARIHHQQGERAEAAAQYDAVLAAFAKEKARAAEALKNPAQFANQPQEKARLEALLKSPPPDHVARSQFYLAVLRYEDGRFADAQAQLGEFLKSQPGSPLAPHAQLRIGFTQVQLRQYADAQKTLAPIPGKYPQLADQALFWTAKAQAGAADPANPQAYTAALNNAINTFRQAADRAAQLAGSDPEAKERRGEILFEMADVMVLNKQPKEAAAVYQQILNDKSLPDRDEEVLQRRATALHLAGAYSESDQVCLTFQKQFPRSTLLPAVLFRHAENAYFQALAVEKNPNQPNRDQELKRLNEEIVKRYQAVVDQFPEYAHVNLARYGLGMGHYRKGDLETAKKVLETIPPADRTGPLAQVPYVIADCLLRLAPASADDALAAGMLHDQLKAAVEILEGYVAAEPKGPRTADALLRLGLSYQRLTTVLADPKDRAKAVNDATSAYNKLLQQFPNDPLAPQAVLERAKCYALANNVGGAITELRRFMADPLRQSAVAPLGVIELATLLRAQNNPKEAADVLDAGRKQHEAALQKDPKRAELLHLLRFHHGVALQEIGKLAEARAAFEQVAQQSPAAAVSEEAAMRFGQCLREEAEQKIDQAKKKVASPNPQPMQVAEAAKLNEEGWQKLREAADYLEARAKQFRAKRPDSKTVGRIYYEAAWAWRGLAAFEVKAAHDRLRQEARKKLADAIAKKLPPGEPAPPLPLPVVARSAVPVQPAEQKARDAYQVVVKDFSDTPLANQARLELAELVSERDEWDQAIQLLSDALDGEPPPDLTDRIRVHLGLCRLRKGDAKAALTQFELVANNPKSPSHAPATCYAGECLLQMKDAKGAVKYLAKFRDHPPFHNIPGVTDRALLRLGHALEQAKDWNGSRQAHEQLMGRFPNSPWINEARYGAAWAAQNQKQLDHAVNVYVQVTNATVEEVAAKAQLQIGLCRREQKRLPEAIHALLAVPFTYDYPEWSAAALFEAHRAFVEAKQPEEAVRLLERIVRDYPQTRWAELAREELNNRQKLR